jgi:hypothetical protein
VKKKNQANDDVFKRVSSPKETRNFVISERVKKVNPHQHNADFVASQQRLYSTKGKESELVKAGEGQSEESGRSAAAPSANATTLSKTKIRKLEAAKRAQLEALKRVQKSTLTASIIPPSTRADPAVAQANMDVQEIAITDAVALAGDKQRSEQENQADLGHQEVKEASNASMIGRGEKPLTTHVDDALAPESVPINEVIDSPGDEFGKTLLPDRLEGRQPLGESLVELSAEQPLDSVGNSRVSQADLGHHISANAGTASLDGKVLDQVTGEADLGLHVGANAGTASLDGKVLDQVTGEADLGLHVGANAGTSSLDGKFLDPLATQVGMGHQETKKPSQVSLTGRSKKAPETSVAMSSKAASEASEGDIADASLDAGTETAASPSRLAEKMSKIRSKTDDITNESEALQDSNRKP